MSEPFLGFLRSADRRRWDRFVDEWIDGVSRIARRIAVDPNEADDLVQETFLKLARARGGGSEVASPRSYIFRTVLNLARDRARVEATRARHEEEASRMRAKRTPHGEEQAARSEAAESIYDAMARLPEDLRVAIHLRAVEGLSYAEIAEATGAPVDTVGTRIHRAREALRTLLGAGAVVAGLAGLDEARASGLLPSASAGLRASVRGAAGAGQEGAPISRPRARALRLAVPAALAAILLGFLGYRAAGRWGREVPRLVAPAATTALAPAGGEVAPSDGSAAPPASSPESPWLRTRRIAGLLVDRMTEEPIGDVPVVLGGEDVPFSKARSRTDGRFVAEVPFRAQTVVTVGVRGYRWAWIPLPSDFLELRDRELDLGEVALDPGRTIHLRILTPQGDPIPGARVRTPWDHWRRSQDDELLGYPVADEEGWWTRSGLPHDDEVLLEVSAPGFAARTISQRIHDERGSVPVRLDRAAEVRATVVDAGGRGVPGVEIWHDFVGLGGVDIAYRQGRCHAPIATAGEDGSFRALVPAGRSSRLRIAKRGLGVIEAPPLGAGEALDLGAVQLPEPVAVRARVVDEGGRPVPGCVVALIERRFPGDEYWRDRRVTDGSGSVVLRAPGSGDLAVRIHDRRFIVEEAVHVGGAEATGGAQDIALVARPGRTLRGRVVLPGGEPFRNGGYVLVREAAEVQHELDEDGCFRAPGCPAPPLHVDVQAGPRHVSHVLTQVPEDAVVDLEVPTPPVTLRLRVLEPDGRPARDGPVQARIRAGGYGGGANGVLRGGEVVLHPSGLGPVERGEVPGLFRVSVLCPWLCARGEADVARGPGGAFAAEVRLQAGGTLTGVVHDLDGDPVAEAVILHEVVFGDRKTYEYEESRRRAQDRVWTDADGRFFLTRAEPGRYTLLAWAAGPRGGVGRIEGVTVRPGEETSVTIRLGKGGSLRGRVVDILGRPVEDVAVEVSTSMGPPQGSWSLSLPVHPLTAADGTFLVEGLPADGVHVHLETGERRASRFVEVPAGETTEVDLLLEE